MISVVVLVVDALPTFLRRLHPAPSATASACRPPASPLPTTPLADHVPKPPPRSASSTCQIVIAERSRTMVKNTRRQQPPSRAHHQERGQVRLAAEPDSVWSRRSLSALGPA